ncbi:Fumarate reductase cytochrome b subunit [hydrothermal vent metagenome]|uniref:Fumarate reductase cytochrome b subunit n=1 Tax=hydrothermal vent metagenome TaxID=652676 RepID=A0A1W1BSK3_9ZZZZ
MFKERVVESLLGMTTQKRKSKIPAKLDFLQSATGLILALFILFHLIFESSILLGKDSMYTLTKMFEGEFIIEGGSPIFISGLAIVISAIFVFHAFLAMRKFPSSYREYMRFRTHAKLMNHADTNLWFIQITSGFMLFFLGSIHLYIMMTQPQNIGPFASSDRIYSDMMWPMYLMLLVSVILHAGVGVYRLIMKWGWFDGEKPRENRIKTRKIIKMAVVFYLLIGLFSLASYMKIGYKHQVNYGERYNPQMEVKNAD